MNFDGGKLIGFERYDDGARNSIIANRIMWGDQHEEEKR